jgi:two-component system cit operon sensor histidine kinase CitA
MKVSFQIKLFISLVAFFSVLFALLGGYYYADVGKQLYQEMSARAKIQAEEIALIPSLRNEVEQKDITAIHDFMQKMAAHSDASFIVIGDNTGSTFFIPSLPTEWAQRWLAATMRPSCREKHDNHP